MSFFNNSVYKKLLLACLAIFVTAVIIEIGMRILNISPPVSLHLYPPNSKLRDVQSHWDITYKVNSKGFRDDEYKFGPKPDSVDTRIVTIGDSFTFGQGVLGNEVFPELLEHKLSEDKKSVEVINVSNIGIGPESYYYILKDIGLEYDPDLVIVNAYANDASKVRSDRYLKKFVKNISSHSHLLSFLRNLQRKLRIRKNKEKYESRMNDFVNNSDPEIVSYMADYKEKYGNKTTNLISGIVSDKYEVLRWVETDPNGAGWSEFKYYLSKMNDLCIENGCKLIIGIVPDGAQIDPKQVEIRQALGVPIDKSPLTGQGAFQNLIKEFALSNDIPVFDPLEDFRNEQVGLYYESDSHWTPKGHQLYADLLARYLKSKYLIQQEQ